MILIFAFSSQNAVKSSKTSGTVVTVVIETVYPNYETFPVEKQLNIIDIATNIVRKTAHFLEYFVLGILSFFNFISFKKLKFVACTALSFAFCVLYSIGDEIHQYFVPGRACRIFDVFIDSAGSFVAIVLLVGIVLKNSKICSKLREINA